MRRVTADARKVYMLTCVFLLASGPFHNDSCKSYIHFLSAFIDTDDCTPCIDRSFNPEELVEKICHESVDFGKIIEKVTCDYYI